MSPYSPELNPVEAIGDLFKDKIGKQLGETLEVLATAIGEELRPLWKWRNAYGLWFHTRA